MIKCTAIAVLFFNSFWSIVLLVPFLRIWIRKEKEEWERKRQKKLLDEFKEGLESLIVVLHAGYSLENAFVEARNDLYHLFGKESGMVKEFDKIVKQMKLKIPVEELLMRMSERLKISEITEFSEMIVIGKKSGGNLIHMIEKTSTAIREAAEVECEIETMVSAKLLEHKVMCLLPYFMIAYVRITTPHFFDGIYQSLAGDIFMFVMFLLIQVADFMGRKLVQIEV